MFGFVGIVWAAMTYLACAISLGGLFFNTHKTRPVGTAIELDFLVQEGQIRADAVVRHRLPDRGWGVKFTGITEQDRPRFAALMRRLRAYANESGSGAETPDPAAHGK
jgi:hypothetical protein